MAHEIRIKIRGYHIDVFGHVNNARYLEFLEEARWSFLEAHWDFWTSKRLGFVVAELCIRYRKPLFMGEEITIQTWVSSIQNTRGVISQRVIRGEEVVSEAEITFALLDGARGRPMAITGEIREKLEQLGESI